MSVISVIVPVYKVEPYLCQCLDSDDYWLPTTLEALYTEAERNQTQVLVFGAIPFWDGMEEPEKHPVYHHPVYHHTVQNGVVQTGPESLKTVLDAGEYYTSPCLRFYLLRYIRETGLRFDEGIIHEDERVSFLTYLFAERVECIGERFYQRRYRPGSTMTSKSIRSSVYGYRIGLDGLLDVFESHSRSLTEEALLGRYCVSRATRICDLYLDALMQRQETWKTARWIQRDSRQTMKRLRSIPAIPRSSMPATYSLYLYGLCRRVKKLKHFLRRSKIQNIGV